MYNIRTRQGNWFPALNENHYHVHTIRKGITHISFYHANRDPNPGFGHTLL